MGHPLHVFVFVLINNNKKNSFGKSIMKKKELNDIKMKSEKLKMIYVHFLISFQQQHKKITFLYIL